MKKTLIALAVLAASGASFAQVTITGELAMGYRTTTTGGATTSDASGFGVDTSEIYFAATEDLGGGMKAKATMAIGGLDRGGYVAGGGAAGLNAGLTLTTGYGAFNLATSKSSQYLSGGVAGLGVYWNGWDGKVFGARTSSDKVSFVAPVGPVSLTLGYEEDTKGLGLGAGTTGTAGPLTDTTGQRLAVLGAKYAAGPLVADAQYHTYDSTGKSDALNKDRYRLSGSYDLGMAQLGAGLEMKNSSDKRTTTDTLLAVKVPMGSLTLGAQWANRKVADSRVAATNGDTAGYSLQAQYNLSKRTYALANYARWDSAINVKEASSQVNMLLVHDF